VAWIQKAKENYKSVIVIRELEGFLGRLGFSAQVLAHVRPYLAPLYAWCSQASKSHCSKLPVAIVIVLSWIGSVVSQRPVIPLRRTWVHRGELFRADAKAEKNLITVGGWEVIDGGLSPRSRWFSVDLDMKSAPWAFWRGLPFRAIAALELYASLLCVMAFEDRLQGHGDAEVVMSATTDNLGNESIVKRNMTTRFPGCIVLLELSSQLARLGANLQLKWRRRDDNQEADDLTNKLFGKFCPERRVALDLERLPWKAIPPLWKEAQAMYSEILASKCASSRNPRKKARKLSLRNVDPW
jgi:hypothetical protein